MREPRIETISAATSAVIGVLFMRRIIIRPYVFVKWSHAEGVHGAQAAPARGDPRGRTARVRPTRLRGRDRCPARGGDRPLPGRDLQLLREQGRTLRRRRRPIV